MKPDHLFDESKEGPILRVHVQPGAGREEIVGTYGDALKVKVLAPPVSGRANKAVIGLLSRELGIDPSTMEITSGQGGRVKRLRIRGIEAGELARRLGVVLPTSARSGRPGRS